MKNMGSANEQEQLGQNSILQSTEDVEYLVRSVQKLLEEPDAVIQSWKAEPLNPGLLNFTTSGIYRIRGMATIVGASLSWSLILKCIRPDSAEKEDVTYHNYWKREAEIFSSGLLDHLPGRIIAPRCFAIQDRPDQTIGLWMEDVSGHSKCNHVWPLDDWGWIAERIGEFHGAYLTGTSLPQQEWICPYWLKSWVRGCRQYAPSIQEPKLESGRGDDDTGARGRHIGVGDSVRYACGGSKQEQAHSIWQWFNQYSGQMDKVINSLDPLPRVLSHQDLAQGNIFMPSERLDDSVLTLIDWQFMSISGVGEELGKLFGVNASFGHITAEDIFAAKEEVFNRYVHGLRTAGWMGDERLARYGYCVAVAARSMWEVPEWLKWVEQSCTTSDINEELDQKISTRARIITIQKEMSSEAAELAHTLFNQE
ncbi:phosphotransferase [Paenibacillus sp. LS1]|uniref:phosphotransferase n=1 Tax=Paenibacillus sp. LS1 TaxID=2992120 RepID=UPI0022317CBC|nr:phosphotransferase [Paenibacillus sp. LS1]MCW3794571.1 phosphotransferase [Paenibacillus sp. LS1]